MFNSDGTINKNYNSFKKNGLIAKIFKEHWNETYQNNKDLIDKYRCNATIEVEKIINCYNKNLGCSVYECPKLNRLINLKKDKKIKKKKYLSKIKYIPSFFAFLHTFGRDLKRNTHIHVLLAEIKLRSDSIYKNWNYFNFDSLSKRFQKILLDLLPKEIGSSFNKFKNSQYLKHKNGYYVYTEDKDFPIFQSGVEYVTIYYGRPAISENRIINYDGENITFCYNNHVDEDTMKLLYLLVIYYDFIKTFNSL